MSYQVLARKWRPQNFQQLVGQEHVQRALVNALNDDRLHHAYLFTGTRGVGKTTIAKNIAHTAVLKGKKVTNNNTVLIEAKSLNVEIKNEAILKDLKNIFKVNLLRNRVEIFDNNL